MDKFLYSFDKVNLLGIDILGRDILFCIIYGIRYFFFMILVFVGIVFIFGIILGLLVGYFGGIVDIFIMRFVDMMVFFLGIIFVIVIVGFLGFSMINVIIVILVVIWFKYVRFLRSMVLKIKKELYVEVVRFIGSKDKDILFKYILLNMVIFMLVIVILDIGVLMFEIFVLLFLGFGV